jgi:hypothetical protein
MNGSGVIIDIIGLGYSLAEKRISHTICNVHVPGHALHKSRGEMTKEPFFSVSEYHPKFGKEIIGYLKKEEAEIFFPTTYESILDETRKISGIY